MQQRPSEPPDLAQIVAQHRTRVRRVLRARGVAERDLPDAEQEVFLVVHRKLAEFEGRSSLATWLHRIASNIASEHRRRARNRYEVLPGDAAPDGHGADPAAQLEAREVLERVCTALETLSVEQREAFLLHELGGLPMHEVAAQLHVPLKTAFSRFYAARRGLHAALGQRGVAVSALWAWSLLWWPSRWLSRARALAPALPRLLQVPLAGVVLLCSVLPPVMRAPAARPVMASASASATLQPVAVAQVHAVRPIAHEPAPSAFARVGATPRRAQAAPIRAPRRVANALAAIAVPVPEAPAPDPTAAPEPGDELVVTRSGAVDLRPRIESPLGAYLPAPPKPARIQLRGPRDAASALEESLADVR